MPPDFVFTVQEFSVVWVSAILETADQYRPILFAAQGIRHPVHQCPGNAFVGQPTNRFGLALDNFLGIQVWPIFLDHFPGNLV